MTECITQQRVHFHPDRPVDVAFDGPELSSDGGFLLLRQVDDQLGLTGQFARLLPDKRDGSRVVHSRHEQIRQRVFQIAAGYEDCNDADSLRHDRVLKVACDRLPEDEEGLSSQPTFSRLENEVDWRSIRKAMLFLEETYVAGLPTDTETVVLDIDSTDDETHGAQQLSFFHGYYDHHMYHQLLIFDGEGHLVTALLRPGNTHASRGAAGLLERVIRTIKRRFPQASIVVRGDSGFAVPRMYRRLEALDRELGGIDYLLGIARNPTLQHLAADGMVVAKELSEATRKTVRFFCDFEYAAKTWNRKRHVIAKCEHGRLGPNPRFIVTSLAQFPSALMYRHYCARGQAENHIKELKSALFGDRLSCHRFAANFFRLILHSLAYRLMFVLRAAIGELSPSVARHQFDTIRLKLLKVGAMVQQSVRRILVRLPQAFPMRVLFGQLLKQLARPAPTT